MLDFKPFQTVKISTVISYKYLKSLFFYSYFPIPPQQTHEAVFRQRHDEIEQQTYDLTIKSSDDKDFIKNIEVKRTTSPNPSQLAKNIKEGFEQVGNDTVAVYLPNHKNNTSGIDYAKSAFAEAKRKGWIHGTVEVWFSDSKKMSDRLIFN